MIVTTEVPLTDDELPFPVEEPKTEEVVPSDRCMICWRSRTGINPHPTSFHTVRRSPPLKSEVGYIPPEHIVNEDGEAF